MVKVINTYNFKAQNTYSVLGDIVATCLIGSNRLAVAHSHGLIEMIPLKKSHRPARRISSPELTDVANGSADRDPNDNRPAKEEVKYSFMALDKLQHVEYCPNVNYLLTLEQWSRTPDSHRTYARVYWRFEQAEYVEDAANVNFAARIANRTTPNRADENKLDLVELPIICCDDRIEAMPNIVTCCPVSGTIAIASENEIYFFTCRYRHLNRTSFPDFIQTSFFIRLSFKPKKLTIRENVVACLDADTLVVFKIIDLREAELHDETRTDTSSRVLFGQQSVDTTGTSTTLKHQNRVIDFEVAKQCGETFGMPLQSDIESNWDETGAGRHSSVCTDDRPYAVNDVTIEIFNTGVNISSTDGRCYTVRSLLQLRLRNCSRNAGSSNQPTGQQIHDEFRCVALKATYFDTTNQSDSLVGITTTLFCASDESSHVLISPFHKDCVGFTLVVTTVADGYVYQFTKEGNWYAENAKCLTVYPFTSPVVDIVIDEFVIHAITANGIETFSSRVGHKLFSNRFEYPTLTKPYPEETSPLVDMPICAMGMFAFYGVRFVTSSCENLVLLTTGTDSTRPQKQNDKAESASSSSSDDEVSSSSPSRQSAENNNSPARFRDEWTIYDLEYSRSDSLLDELIYQANEYRATSTDACMELLQEAHVIARIALKLLPICGIVEAGERSVLRQYYVKISALLADLTILSDRKEIYSQAIAYYNMCKYTIKDIFLHFKENNKTDNTDGLFYTLTYALREIGSNRSSAEILKQPLTAASDRTLAEELGVLYMGSPNSFVHVALCSSVVREMMSDRLLQMFAGMDTLSATQKCCYMVCLCHEKRYDDAHGIFKTMRRSDLFLVLHEYWTYLLFENFHSMYYRQCTWSEFTEYILFRASDERLEDAVADVFISIAVVNRQIQLPCLIKLFINYLAMSVGNPGYKKAQSICEKVLQAFLYEHFKYDGKNDDDVCEIDLEMEEAEDTTPTHSQNVSMEMDSGDVEVEPYRHVLFTASTASSSRESSNDENSVFEATKLLIRMYMAVIRMESESATIEETPIDSILPETQEIRLNAIQNLHERMELLKIHHKTYDRQSGNRLTAYQRAQQSARIMPDYETARSSSFADRQDSQITHFRRPIVFYEKRENFLNKMPPLCLKTDANGVPFSNDWGAVDAVFIKFQSLLSSGKLPDELMENVVAFLQTTPNVLGLDSLLMLLLPTDEAIDFLIKTNPIYLLDFARSRLVDANSWQQLLRAIVTRRRELNALTRQKGIDFYNKIIEDILRFLVSTNSFKDFLDCIPDEEKPAEQHMNIDGNPLVRTLTRRHLDSIPEEELSTPLSSGEHAATSIGQRRRSSEHLHNTEGDQNPKRRYSQDGVNELNPFEVIIREAVLKQRQDMLNQMIQSSGRQLNDAVNQF